MKMLYICNKCDLITISIYYQQEKSTTTCRYDKTNMYIAFTVHKIYQLNLNENQNSTDNSTILLLTHVSLSLA